MHRLPLLSADHTCEPSDASVLGFEMCFHVLGKMSTDSMTKHAVLFNLFFNHFICLLVALVQFPVMPPIERMDQRTAFNNVITQQNTLL